MRKLRQPSSKLQVQGPGISPTSEPVYELTNLVSRLSGPE